MQSQTRNSLFSRLSDMQSRISEVNHLPEIEGEVLSQINRNNLRLDQIIEVLKKVVKTEQKGNKKRDTSITPDKTQPKKLKDRVEKLLAQNQSIKYIK